MYPKLLNKMASTTPRQVRPTTPHQRCGMTNRTTSSQMCGQWAASLMKCAAYIYHSKPKIWQTYSKWYALGNSNQFQSSIQKIFQV